MKGVVCLAALIAAGCSGASLIAATGPLRGEFVIVEVDGAAVGTPVSATVTFEDDGAVTGDAGCNRFGGSFQQDGGAITIGPLMASRRACEPQVMDVARRILASLQASRSLTVGDDGAVLLSGDAPHRLRLQPVAR